MTSRRLSRLLVLTMMATGAALAYAAPASAALYSCNSWSSYYPGSNQIYQKPTLGLETHNTNCVLGVGNQSGAVTVLQDALNRCYQQGLVVDGDYGPKTRQAVINVQRRIGTAADGVYGPQLRALVEADLRGIWHEVDLDPSRAPSARFPAGTE